MPLRPLEYVSSPCCAMWQIGKQLFLASRQISDRKPGALAELAAEQAKELEKESAELEQQAARLAEEIKELSGEAGDRIG